MGRAETSLPHSSPSEAEGPRGCPLRLPLATAAVCALHPHAGGRSTRMLLPERWKLSLQLLVHKWEFTELSTCCIRIKDTL